MTLAHRMALNGEYSEGLSTMVQPAASAGTDFRRHLVHRPIPRRDQGADADRFLHQPRGAAHLFELKVFSTSIMALMWPTPIRVCDPLASVMGAPISVDMACAMSL